MIIGIAGTIASGKGTVVEYLTKKGFAHYSVSGILKEILRERGLPETRTYMSPLANELLAKHEGGVLYLAHERATKSETKDYILESIHRTSEADYVRSIGGVIIGVDADLKKRYERTVLRKDGAKDDVTFEEFLEHAKREDEGEGGTGPNIRAVLSTADAVLMNNGTLEELHAQVDEALEKIKK
jgi:dephospho-CoA kinase